MDAKSDEHIISVSASGAGSGDAGLVGAASVITQDGVDNESANLTSAYIDSDSNRSIAAEGNISVSATGNSEIDSVAGGAGFGGTLGFGASNSTVVRNDAVNAYIGQDTQITAKGKGNGLDVDTGEDGNGNKVRNLINGLSVTATSSEDFMTIAAAGAGGGTVGVAGSVPVNKLTETTKAYIDKGAKVNEIGSDAGNDINVLSSDDTKILSIAGSGAIGGEVGVGASSDVSVLSKDTQAYIAASVKANAKRDIKIQALSDEDLTSVAGTLSVGGSVGVGGAASVYVVDSVAKAYIGSYIEGTENEYTAADALIHSDGNLLLWADDDMEIDIIGGSLAGGAYAGVGGSAGVPVITKTSQAFIAGGADVSADGSKAAVNVRTGEFTIAFENDPDDPEEAKASGIGIKPDLSDDVPKDADGNPGTNRKIDDPGFAQQRTAKAKTQNLKGLAVTATSRDDIETITAVGSGAIGAVSIAGSANVITSNTSAYIDDGAQINTSGSGDAAQSVLVAAGSDYYHMGMAGAASFGGGGVSPSADVTVVTNNTEAYIGESAQVEAKKDIQVTASAEEDILSVSAGLAAGGVSIAGTVAVISLDNHTYAHIDGKATADGNVVISAKDYTDTDLISGAASIGFGSYGVGAAVGPTIINKDNQAYIDDGAVVEAKATSESSVSVASGYRDSDGDFLRDSAGDLLTEPFQGLAVQADSSEDVFAVAATGAGGAYAGIAGASAVNTINSDTKAYIGAKPQGWEDDNVTSDYDVRVWAFNDVEVFSIGGSVSGGAAGIAGRVDAGTIKNNTSAYINDEASVDAANDVDVDALSHKDVESFAASASGGAIGVAGGLSIYTIGTELDTDSRTHLQEQRYDSDQSKLDWESQIADNRVKNLLNGYGEEANGNSYDPDPGIGAVNIGDADPIDLGDGPGFRIGFRRLCRFYWVRRRPGRFSSLHQRYQ